ncbi:MAG: hypothetical protein AAGH15_23240 [Myxococcota bacterium]
MRGLLAGLLVLSACARVAPAGPTLPEAGDAPPGATTWTGTVLFEARSPTPTGASRTTERLPAVRVELRAVDAEGNVVGDAVTDAAGAFRLAAAPGARELEVRASLADRVGSHPAPRLAVTRDGLGDTVHTLRVPLGDPATPLAIVAEDEAGTLAGALHILDAMRRGVEAVERWTGERLPPFFAYWDRGVTTTWSFYTGERPQGSGRYTIELLGGEPGRRALTDTDEHDESIVLHELGHFVMDVLTTDSSPGGGHPGGVLLDPGLAWEEGRATWFAAAVQGRPRYLDTIGLEPAGELRVAHDLERGRGDEVKGLGSEAAVAEILWDLTDGAEGFRDDDVDGVALGPAAVLEAMRELAGVEGAYPALPTFLQHLVASGRVPGDRLRTLLTRAGQPAELLPGPHETPPWPIDIALPAEVEAKVDGVTDPAPSGGPARPSNGIDAMRVFRFHLPEAGRVRVRLRIEGSGSHRRDQTDLDIELRDLRAELLASSRSGNSPDELISRQLPAGHYLIYVRDGGNGNRAEFHLEVARETW